MVQQRPTTSEAVLVDVRMLQHVTMMLLSITTMGHALSQLLPTSIVTATAWWQLTVLASVEDLPLKTSVEFAEDQELQKELVTATAMLLTSVVFVVAMASLKVLATATATFLTSVAFVVVQASLTVLVTATAILPTSAAFAAVTEAHVLSRM